MKSALIIMLCFLSACYAAFLYLVPEDTIRTPPKLCANPKIQVELAGHLLEFKRDEADVYTHTIDQENVEIRSDNLSKDCDVEYVKNTSFVSYIDLDMPVRFAISGEGQAQVSTYEKYIDEARQYESNAVSKGDGILYIEKNKKAFFFILENTRNLEFDGKPILLECGGYGCRTRYRHPSGIFLSYTIIGGYKNSKIRDLINMIHTRFERFIIN